MIHWLMVRPFLRMPRRLSARETEDTKENAPRWLVTCTLRMKRGMSSNTKVGRCEIRP